MENEKSCLLNAIVIIGGLYFISFLYKGCVGLVVQHLPDDEEYAVTDDDYYHRSHCACVNEYNIDCYLDYEDVINEGLKPCSILQAQKCGTIRMIACKRIWVLFIS